MSDLAGAYRRKGREAATAEKAEQDPFIRHLYAKISGHWHELAERVEKEEAARASLPTSATPKSQNVQLDALWKAIGADAALSHTK